MTPFTLWNYFLNCYYTLLNTCSIFYSCFKQLDSKPANLINSRSFSVLWSSQRTEQFHLPIILQHSFNVSKVTIWVYSWRKLCDIYTGFNLSCPFAELPDVCFLLALQSVLMEKQLQSCVPTQTLLPHSWWHMWPWLCFIYFSLCICKKKRKKKKVRFIGLFVLLAMPYG